MNNNKKRVYRKNNNKNKYFTSYPMGDFFTLDNLSSSFQSSCLASTVNRAHQYLKIK